MNGEKEKRNKKDRGTHGKQTERLSGREWEGEKDGGETRDCVCVPMREEINQSHSSAFKNVLSILKTDANEEQVKGNSVRD